MPILRSSKKALKVAARRHRENLVWKKNYKIKIRQYKKNSSGNKNQKELVASLIQAQSSLDKATKAKVIHKNKASRLKSKLAKTIKK